MYSYIAMNTSVIITVRNQMHITWFFGIATFGLSSSSDELLQAEVDESSSSCLSLSLNPALRLFEKENVFLSLARKALAIWDCAEVLAC